MLTGPGFQQVNEAGALAPVLQRHTHTVYSSYPAGMSSAQLLSENSAFPGSCHTNHLMAAERADKGELWFQVLLAGKSPNEEAIIYLITLTIPLWQSICFLLWTAAEGRPVIRHWVLSSTFTWIHWVELLFLLEAGEAHVCERWRGTSLCQTQETFLLWQPIWRRCEALYLEREIWVTQIFVCLGEGPASPWNLFWGCSHDLDHVANTLQGFKVRGGHLKGRVVNASFPD